LSGAIRRACFYCVFDLLYLDGKDLRGKTLLERKAELEKILPKSPLLLYSAHVVGEGIKAFNRAKRTHEEGIIAKLASGRYHSGVRTREWLKVKASQEQEVVIIGFTAARRTRWQGLEIRRAGRDRIYPCDSAKALFGAQAAHHQDEAGHGQGSERGQHDLGETEARRRG